MLPTPRIFPIACVAFSIFQTYSAAQGAPDSVVRRFPAAFPGESIVIRKVLDPETGKSRIESNSPRVNSGADLVVLEDEEAKAIRRKHGALDAPLRNRFEKLGEIDETDLVVYLKRPSIRFLDKSRTSEHELKAQSQLIASLPPAISPENFVRKHGLSPVDGATGRLSVRSRVSKKKLKAMMFDDDIAQISMYHEPIPLQMPFTSLASSAYNPASGMPADARGQGIKVATFESGLTTDFRNCLGNLAASQIDINASSGSHSLQTFKCLWQTATGADWWHRNSFDMFVGDGDEAFIVNNGIQSMSQSRAVSNSHPGCPSSPPSIHPTDANHYPMLKIDEWAYRWPYPVFCNPAANWGHQYESNWQCYNAISVGNVRHTNQNHYEMPILERPVCEVSDGANQARNPQARYGGPTFKPANAIYPYASGDREMPYIVVPGITPSTTQAMNDGCIPPNITLPREALWAGTSYSAPTANGIAASILSSDSRMRLWPEKVRAVMIVTAENVHGGYWNTNNGGADGLDGAGVVSGKNAVAFARNHSTVGTGDPAGVRDGMIASSIYTNEWSNPLDFKALVPNPKPAGHHLRVVLTWDSNPVANGDNRLSDLDLTARYAAGAKFSRSFNGNVEMVDIPASSLVAGSTVDITVSKVTNRIPADQGFFYYALAWTWVKDHAL